MMINNGQEGGYNQAQESVFKSKMHKHYKRYQKLWSDRSNMLRGFLDNANYLDKVCITSV